MSRFAVDAAAGPQACQSEFALENGYFDRLAGNSDFKRVVRFWICALRSDGSSRLPTEALAVSAVVDPPIGIESRAFVAGWKGRMRAVGETVC